MRIPSGADAPNPAAQKRLSPADVKTTRAVRVLGSEFAANDEQPDLTPEDVEQEVRRIEADVHKNAMKRSGEWDQRRLERGQGL